MTRDDRVNTQDRGSLRGAGAFLVLAAFVLSAATAWGAGPRALKIGDPPPRFSLSDLSGKTVTIPDDLKGKAVIIHFWADWCQYCVEEMPALEALYQQYRGKGLVIVAVNVGQTADVSKAFAERLKITYPIVVDGDSSTAKEYSVLGLPRTFFLDRKGLIKYKLLGEANAETLERLIKNTL